MRSRLLRPAWQRCWPEFLFAILIWWLQILESHSSLNQIKNQATDSEKWLSIQSKIEINEKHLKNNRTPVREILQSFSNIEQLLGSVIDSTTSNKIEAAIGSEQITTNQSKTNQTIGLEITEKEKHQINLEREDHQRSINRSPEKMSSAATRRQARFEAGNFGRNGAMASSSSSSDLSVRLVRRSTGASGQNQAVSAIQALVGQRLLIPCSNLSEPQRPIPAGSVNPKRINGQRFRVSGSQQAGRYPAVNVANGQGISLIVWHKDNRLDSPIFTIDARGASSLREAKQQIGDDDEQRLKGRAHFEESTRLDSRGFGQIPALVIDEASKQDAGTYTCTVEFHKAPTQAYQVQVILQEPVRNMIIRDTGSLANEISGLSTSVGPYDEDSSQTFTCEVDAGKPAGQVSWWQLDSSIPLNTPPSMQSGQQTGGPLTSQARKRNKQINSIMGDTRSSMNEGYLTTLSLDSSPLHTTAISSASSNDLTQRTSFGPNYLVAFHPTSQQSSDPTIGGNHLDGLSLPFSDGQRLKHWSRLNSTTSNIVNESGKIQSILQVTLSRSNLGDEYLCLASNNDDYLPLNSSIVISMNLKPTEVRIENKSEQMFKLGQKTIVQCQVIGSKPSAKITWFRGTEELILPKHNVYNDSLVTAQPDFVSELSRNLNTWTSVSYLTFVPKLTDNQRPLTCQAQNLKLQNSPAMSDSIVMNVQYPPILNLSLGANIRVDNIKIGTDVFMDCDVQANPPINDLVWMFNDKQMQARDLPEGVIMSNLSLVVQRIKIEHRGTYQCVAQNLMGKTASNRLELRPRFEPRCDTTKTRSKYELTIGQPARIECHMMAEPGDDLTFSWKFNQTRGGAGDDGESGFYGYSSVEDIKQFETNYTSSFVMFTPETKRRYGHLLCKASNAMGNQGAPCVIKLVPSELPDPVFSCFFDNPTTDSLSVHCQGPAGQSVGSRQSYLLELYTNSTDQDAETTTTRGTSTKSSHLKQSRQQHQSDNNQQDFLHDESSAEGSGDQGDEVLQETMDIRGMRQVAKLSSDSPSFHVHDLKPATNYNFIVYVTNSKGRSAPASYQASTLPLDSASSGSRVSFQGRSEQMGFQSQLSERVKSFLRIGDYFSGENSGNPMIGVAIAVILGALSVFLISLLLIKVCHSTPSSRRRNISGSSDQRGNKRKRARGDSVAPVDDDDRLVAGQSHQLVSSSSNSNKSGSNSNSGGFHGNGSDTSRETNTDSTLISSPRVSNSVDHNQRQQYPQHYHRDSESCCSQLMTPQAGNLISRAKGWQVDENPTGSQLQQQQIPLGFGPTPSPMSMSPHMNANGSIYSSIRQQGNKQLSSDPARDQQTPQVSIQSGSEYTTSQNVDDPASDHQDQSQLLFSSSRNGQPIYLIGNSNGQPTDFINMQQQPPLAFWTPCQQQQLVAGDSSFDSSSLTANRCQILAGDNNNMQTVPQATAHMLPNSMSIPVSLKDIQDLGNQVHHVYHQNQRRFSQDLQLQSCRDQVAGSYLTLAPETLAIQQRFKQQYQQQQMQDDPLLLAAANLSPPEKFAFHTAYCASTLDDPRRMRNRSSNQSSTGSRKCFDTQLASSPFQQQQQRQHRVKFEHDDPQQSDGLDEGSRLTQTSTETEATGGNSAHYL